MMVVCPIFLYAVTLLNIALYSRNIGRPTMISEIYYGTGRSLLLPCMGLAFVGAAPAYLSQGERPVHKGAAIMSAFAGTLWCLTMEPCVVTVAALISAIASLADRRCWLFWCEICTMTAVLATVVIKSLAS